jgi:hypothetical protein
VVESGESAPVVSGSKSKTWDTTVGRVPSWPEEARPLKRRDWVAHLFSVGDVILVLLPIYFICTWKSQRASDSYLRGQYSA